LFFGFGDFGNFFVSAEFLMLGVWGGFLESFGIFLVAWAWFCCRFGVLWAVVGCGCSLSWRGFIRSLVCFYVVVFWLLFRILLLLAFVAHCLFGRGCRRGFPFDDALVAA
jgi:hypothetical protein